MNEEFFFYHPNQIISFVFSLEMFPKLISNQDVAYLVMVMVDFFYMRQVMYPIDLV